MDQELGPFDENELKLRWVKGDLLPIDYVYDERQGDWVLLADVFAWARTEEHSTPLRPDEVVIRRSPPPPATPVVQLPDPVKIVDVAPPPLKGQQVEVVGGEAVIELGALGPGDVELVLHDDTHKVSLEKPVVIHVKPAEASEIKWSLPSELVVGHDLDITVRAVDNEGQTCLHYNERFVLQIRGEIMQDLPLVTHDGQATLRLSHTKAETWSLTLLYDGDKSLRLPPSATLRWLPGEAVHFVVDGPVEHIAGQPLQVRVKAVDAFGNVATHYRGKLVLEVKAS